MRPNKQEQRRRSSIRSGGLGLGLLAIALSCGLGLWCHAAEGPVGQARVYKKVGDRELRLFVVNPEDWQAADQRPALVLFHGGGWTGGSPVQFNDQAAYLARRGMVCIQVEYRLVKDVPGPPVHCVQDAKSAMRWVRSHAAELGIDPQRIGAGGGSAGGHLAAFVGMAQGLDDPQDDLQVSPKANALVLFNPVFDNGPDGGWGQQRVGDRYKEFSPAHNVSADDPPAIVFLGRNDALIDVRVVERFQTNMTAANVRCETRYYEGQSHGFFNKDPWKTITLAEADKFLASLGWLKGEPSLQVPALPKPAEMPAAAAKKKRKTGGP
jgi:acetyl esterase/lipase